MAVRLPLVALLAALALAAPASAAGLHLRPADREAIRDVLTRYIPAMLERKDVALGWRLSGPQVRGSSTLAEWRHGGVPVYPFPARGDRIDSWNLTYVEPGDVGLDLLIQPRKGAKADPISFRIEMTRIGGSWKVNAFYPEAIYLTKSGRVFSPQDATANGATPQVPQPRVSARWLVVPAVALGALLVLGSLVWLLLVRRRDRSAYVAYLERTQAP